MAQVPGQLTAETGARADTDTNHLSLDGKTLRDEIETAFTEPVFPSPNGMSRRNPATGGLTSATFMEALGEEMRKSWPKATTIFTESPARTYSSARRISARRCQAGQVPEPFHFPARRQGT